MIVNCGMKEKHLIQMLNEYSPQLSKLKNRRHSHTLKGSHSMGDGRIFLKSRRDASFNKDLSNEPNLDRIHLAGQYL
jgi:hypothetical protein